MVVVFPCMLFLTSIGAKPTPLFRLTLIDLPPHSLQLDLANSVIRECGIAQYRQ